MTSSCPLTGILCSLLQVKWFLDNKDRLKAFSRNARLFAENRSWTVVMEEMERYYEMATDATRQRLPSLHLTCHPPAPRLF